MQFAEDDIPFANILKAMGIENFEHSVPTALNEYAERFALELLRDAKDYSIHANHTEITPEDVKLAVKLCDVRVTGVDQRDSVVKELSEAINKKNLLDVVNPDAVLNRYPPDIFDQLPHTYVPGAEAYYIKEDEDDDHIKVEDNPMEVDNNISSGQKEPTSTLRFHAHGKGGKKLEPSPGFEEDS